MNAPDAVSGQTHKFELAGLGRYPFRCVGHYEAKFQACHGAPVLPGSSCDYCGTAIMQVFRIQSSDGKSFKVGIDCVAKTGDAGLKSEVKAIQRQRRHAAKQAKVEAKRTSRAAQVAADKTATLATHAGLAEALAADHGISRDLASKLDTWGKLSPAQVALALRVAAETKARAEEVKVPAPVGDKRVTFRGTVVSARVDRDELYGRSTVKILVKVRAEGGGVWLAWGTAPGKVLEDVPCGDEGRVKTIRGAEVEITAKLEAGDEPSFCFTRRPSGKLIRLAAAEAS